MHNLSIEMLWIKFMLNKIDFYLLLIIYVNNMYNKPLNSQQINLVFKLQILNLQKISSIRKLKTLCQ